MKHAKYSPSKLSQVELCPGSVVMQEGLEEKITPSVEEGKLLHLKMEEYFSNRGINKDGLTEEQISLLNYCYSVVMEKLKLFQESNGSISILKEQKIDIANGLTYGHIDLALIGEKEAVLFDYKFGYAEVIDTENNLQTACYAVGLYELYGIENILAVIIQPRINKVSEFNFNKDRLLSAKKIIIDIISSVENSEEVVLRPGEKQCKYCRAISFCPAVKKSSFEIVKSEDFIPSLSPEKISILLDKFPIIEKFIKNIKDYAKNIIESGVEIPNYELSSLGKIREVVDINELYISAKNEFGITGDDFLKACSVSAPAVEKIITEKIYNNLKESGLKITKKDCQQTARQFLSKFTVEKEKSKTLKRINF